VVTRSGRDAASRLLTAAVRSLPADRADWGQAMLAELVSIEPRRARLGFAWGCVRATATQYRFLRGAAHAIAVLAVVGAVFAWAVTIDFLPMTGALDLVVSILAVACWQGRRAAMLGPVGDGVVAWLLRVGGYLLAGAIVLACLTHLNPATDGAAEDSIGPMLLAVVLASYLLGLMTVSARRSAATTRVLATAAGCGLGAATLWLASVLMAPPISPSAGWALTLTVLAAIAAAALNSGRAGGSQRGLLAALLAGTASAGLIVVLVVVLASAGPPNLIPNLSHGLTPADRLAQSRVEIFEPYMVVLALGSLLAAALSAASIATRQPIQSLSARPDRSAEPVR
jgi:hypothetical protein